MMKPLPPYKEVRTQAEKMADLIPHTKYYESSSSATNWLNRKRLEIAKKMLGDLTQKRLLEAGVGDGYIFRELRAGLLHGIDLSWKRLERATAKTRHGSLSQQNIYSLAFKDNSLDAILCADVLEHMNRPDLGARELWRVLKPKGRLVITLPNQLNCFAARVLFRQRPFINPDHLSVLTPWRLASWIGQKPVAKENIPGPGYWLSLHQVCMFIKEETLCS